MIVIVVVGRRPLILVVVMGWCCLWSRQGGGGSAGGGGGGGGGGGRGSSGTLSWSLLQLAAVAVAVVVCGISLAPQEIQKDNILYCTFKAFQSAFKGGFAMLAWWFCMMGSWCRCSSCLRLTTFIAFSDFRAQKLSIHTEFSRCSVH